MRKLIALTTAAVTILSLVAVFAITTSVAAASCTTVATSKGSLSAAVAPNSGDTATGDIDALGCDIGVYVAPGVSATVSGATIHDATMYGVFNDGHVTVDNSTIADIGDHTGADFTPTGNQYGVGVYFNGNGAASGSVTNSQINNYQKNGVAIVNGASATVNHNTVEGLGNAPFIAQNGIEFGFGARGEARGNTINGHWYTGANWTATGMLLFDVNPNVVKTSNNHYRNNQTNYAVITSSSCPHMYGGVYAVYGLCTYP